MIAMNTMQIVMSFCPGKYSSNDCYEHNANCDVFLSWQGTLSEGDPA